MKRLFAAVLSAAVLAGCASGSPAQQSGGAVQDTAPATDVTADSTAAVTEEEEGFDLLRIADASRVSVLTGKYGCIKVDYEMDYGELYNQNMTFFENADGELCYLGVFGEDYEYYDGKYDYWQESSEDGQQCYAYFGVAGANTSMDLDNYIFSYTPEDKLAVNDYTRTEDGSYIIDASETITDSYEDAAGNTVTNSFLYEYMLSATPDCELIELKCSCTDTETGEVDSTLDMKVDYGAKAPEIPTFMDESFTVDTVTIKTDGTEIEETFDVPVGFMPYFVTPYDGEYIFAYDREGNDVIEDTFTISSPCTVYVIMQEAQADGQ